MAGRWNRGAGRIALAGLLTALSLIMLYLSCMMPAARLGVVAAAGLIPAAAVISGGLGTGIFCYAATGLLGLLLIPDKGNAFFYLGFFGLYSIMKALIERLRSFLPEWILKLAFFNGMLTLAYFTLRTALFSGIPDQFEPLWVMYPVGNAAFVLYDFGFSRLISFYTARIDKAIRRR